MLMGGVEYAVESPSTPTTRRRMKLQPKLDTSTRITSSNGQPNRIRAKQIRQRPLNSFASLRTGCPLGVVGHPSRVKESAINEFVEAGTVDVTSATPTRPPSDDGDSWLQLRQIPRSVVSRCSTCRNSHTYPQQPSTCQRLVAPNYVVRSSTASLSNYVAVVVNRSLRRNSLNSYNSLSTA